MRFVGFILILFYLENCNCSSGFSVRPRVPEKYNYGSYSTAKPRSWEKKPNSTQILQTAAEVFESLGNATLQSFVTTFQKINRKRLFTALKGVSILARAIDTQSHKEDKLYLLPKSNALANIVKKNLEILAEKVFSNRNFDFSSINNLTDQDLMKVGDDFKGVKNDSLNPNYMFRQKAFNSLVVNPVNKTSFWMISFMNDPASDANFTSDYFRANWEQVISFTIHETPILLELKRNVSQFNQDTFEEYRSNITRYFLQAFIFQYFYISLQYDFPSSEDMEVLDATFRIRHRQFMKLLKENSLNNDKSFFPGTIKETVVRPAINRIITKFGTNVTNCLFASEISDNLNSSFPSRKYLVIVDDTHTVKDHYAYSGFPKRMIIDDYLGKTVFIFMATKNATENRRVKYNGSELYNAVNMIMDGKDMKTALDSANNAGNFYQMVAFDNYSYTQCSYPVERNFVDGYITGTNLRTVDVNIIL